MLNNIQFQNSSIFFVLFKTVSAFKNQCFWLYMWIYAFFDKFLRIISTKSCEKFLYYSDFHSCLKKKKSFFY